MGFKEVNTQQEIIEYIRESQEFLKETSFSNLLVNTSSSEITIDFCSKYFAIEFQVEWSEQNVTCYIVRLTNGKLPKGYIVDDTTGETCRNLLQEFVKKNGMPDCSNLADQIKELVTSYRKKENDFIYMKKKIDLYTQIIIACIKQLPLKDNKMNLSLV